ncbi:hypothetical protein L249_3115 [Ophiocordyceps polyrhachis-furcata BCC 54312]|uniref:Uncharacterized protein n=1 Tax=Ophiocordyceps polyrhachis-furcata BCC 54312 TaxID=1330021 RepID=A0A367LRJ8_9HYPO|nr:hypothetical protein L249_3115 [Ophiocordyceps polyrhachis-furcata BCC 54312]
MKPLSLFSLAVNLGTSLALRDIYSKPIFTKPYGPMDCPYGSQGHELSCHNLQYGNWGYAWAVNITVQSHGNQGKWEFQSDNDWVTSWQQLENWACTRVRPICIQFDYAAPQNAPSLRYRCGEFNWAGAWSFSGDEDYQETWTTQGLHLHRLFENEKSLWEVIPRPAELRDRVCLISEMEEEKPESDIELAI